MIYLVSNNLSLFEEDCYERISLAAAVNLVNSWECIQFDVETGGRNPHLVPLLCAQFGNKKEDIQIVVDCQNNNNILAFKEPLENKEVIDYDRKLTSKVFKGCLRTAGVSSFKAQIMYLAVDNFQKFCNWKKGG